MRHLIHLTTIVCCNRSLFIKKSIFLSSCPKDYRMQKYVSYLNVNHFLTTLFFLMTIGQIKVLLVDENNYFDINFDLFELFQRI